MHGQDSRRNEKERVLKLDFSYLFVRSFKLFNYSITTINTGNKNFLNSDTKQLNVRCYILKTKNLSRKQILTSFLSRSKELSSSGLQIDCDGHLYASGEMIGAWQNEVLFIDCGSCKVCNRRFANDLIAIAKEKEITPILYNQYAYAPTTEFHWCERLVSYPIWTTPERVNPKNIFAQAKKLLDKAIEKNISYESIHDLVTQTQHIATLFGFEFDATLYNTKRKQQEQLERIKKQAAAQYHLEQYTRITKELEAS